MGNQQTVFESKTRLVEQASACLRAGDYARVLDLLQGAAEFPGDADLSALEKLAQDGLKRNAEANRLITESQELFAQQKSAEAIQALRKAYELDKRNSLARAILANALVEHANSILDTDWLEAEKLTNQALALNPAHPTAKTILGLIVNKKERSSVEDWVSQASKLQSSGDLFAALAWVAEGLAVHPHDPKLLQIQDAIQRDQDARRRQARRGDLDDLRRLQREIDGAIDVAAKQALAERIQGVAAKHWTDGEILSIANALLLRLGLVPQESSTVSPRSKGATVILHVPRPSPPRPSHSVAGESASSRIPVSPAAPSLVPASPVPPSPIPSEKLPTAASPPTKTVTKKVLPGKEALNIAPPAKPIAALPKPLPTAPQAAAVSVVEPLAPAAKITAPSSPAKQGARSNSAMPILLAAGAVVLVAATFFFTRILYAPPVAKSPAAVPTTSAPTSASAVTTAAVSAPAQTSPEPALAALRLSSDISAGRVTLDDQPPADFQNGQWSLDNLPEGEHTLKFQSPQVEASYTFTANAGTFPVLTSPIASKATTAVVLSSMAGHLHVYSSDPAAKVSLDRQLPLNIPKGGLDFFSVSPGAHELALTRGTNEDRYTLNVDAGAVPTLSTFLRSGHNSGSLLVLVGLDDAKVFLNGKLQPQLTHAGQLRMANLELKNYIVQVSKDGFQDPPPQEISIRSGEPATLTFNLQPQPRVAQPQPRNASLTIQGGAPGTSVFVDQALVGTIQTDGTLAVPNVNPGDHTVELRKDRFKPRQFRKHFIEGGAISLIAADAALEAAPGELKINFTPGDAKVALVKGELLTMVSSGVPVNLAAGPYTLTARTADGFTRSSTLDVVAGQTKTFDLPLAPTGMSNWADPGGWKQERDSFVHKGGDFVLYGVPASGTFVLSAMLTKGHLLQWVLNYSDPKNYVLFQMDDNYFYRAVIRNGQRTDEIRVPDKGEKKGFRTLNIRVSPTEIVQQIRHGDSWTVLDRWTQPGTNLSQGKFGFYIPGDDQVAVSSFAHYADLNIR